MKSKELASIRPSQRQLNWQQMEFYGFIHFGINTMNNREWGLGNEDLTSFNPEELDCSQWARSLKEAGMKGAILTCKHHDGFCLWPSKFSKQTVAYTPYQKGSGDIVKEFSEACKEVGLKFGIYLSPWDLTEPSYGYGKAYDDFYVNQLTELLTNYGDIFEVWFDGANGEGQNGRKQFYDWERYYKVIRKLQPNAVIAVCGPDVRWVGNEAGISRENEWSVVPIELRDVEKIAESSQQIDDGSFSRQVLSSDEDLGSREALKDYQGELVWYPAEVNTSIRPGWFYHPSEDKLVRSGDELFALYKKAVGGNSTFLLNIPPMPNGLLNEHDCVALGELGEMIAKLNEGNLLKKTDVTYSGAHAETSLYQLTNPEEVPSISVKFSEKQKLNTLILQEDIKEGQRVEKTSIYYKKDEQFILLKEIASIGFKRIIDFDSIETTELKIVFEEYRESPAILTVEAHCY